MRRVKQGFEMVIWMLASAWVCGGCGLSKDNKGTLPDLSDGAKVLAAMTIQPQDWVVSTTSSPGVVASVQTVKPEKVEEIKKYLVFPRVKAVSLREASGFELYQILGFNEEFGAKDVVFIKPKLFVSSSSELAGVQAYLTGEPNEIALSVPMAYVDGKISALSSLAGSGDNQASSITLPDRYVIRDVVALDQAVSPKKLETLPLCPHIFTLSHNGYDFYGESPFKKRGVSGESAFSS